MQEILIWDRGALENLVALGVRLGVRLCLNASLYQLIFLTTLN